MRSLLCLVLLVRFASAQAPCTIETVVGDPTVVRGDGGPALEAELFRATDVRIGPDGALYIADNGHRRIRRVGPDGVIETFAGNGTDQITGDGGPARQAGIRAIEGFTFAPDGSLYFVDQTRRDNVVRRIDPNGLITTVAGEGAPHVEGSEEFIVSASQSEIAAGPDGSIYVTAHTRIFRIDPEGRVTHFAGSGLRAADGSSVSGDGGPATEAVIESARDIVVDSEGVVYFIDDRNARIRRIELGVIDTVLRLSGRNLAQRLEIDALDRLYVSNFLTGVRRFNSELLSEMVWSGSLLHREFHVAPDGRMFRTLDDQVFELIPESGQTLVAGLGQTAPRGDGGPATSATLGRATGLAIGPAGELYIADADLRRVRVVREGRIEAFAGSGRRGPLGDRGPAVNAEFSGVWDVAVGPDGSVYVTDSNRVRRVDPSGEISTFAGTGTDRCSLLGPGGVNCGDGGPARQAETPSLGQIVARPDGALYFQSLDRGRSGLLVIRKISGDGVISTLPRTTQPPGSLGIGSHPDGLIVLESPVFSLWRDDGSRTAISGFRNFVIHAFSMVADSERNVYVAPTTEGIRRLTPRGILNTIVEHRRGDRSLSGDGGLASEALMGSVAHSMAIDDNDNLYFFDSDHSRIRRVNQASSCPAVDGPTIFRRGLHSATFSAFGLAPGALFTISGRRLGPIPAAGAMLGADGRVTTELAGVRVLVDGVPAPLLFVAPHQINGVMPHATVVEGRLFERPDSSFFQISRFTRLVVEHDGARSDARYFQIRPTAPALFRQLPGLFAAALNQDGSLNGPESPAPPGTVVVLFGSGAGVTDPPSVDGAVSGLPLPRPLAPVEVVFGDEPAEVLYAGAAPGLVSGVIQINTRISPQQQRRGEVEIIVRIGGIRTVQRSTLLAIAEQD